MVLAGTAYGRVRAMLDYTGSRVKDTDPGSPSEILGLSGVPEAGTRFEVVDHERIARDRAQQAEAAFRRQELAVQGGTRRTLEDLLGEGGTQDLNLVVKADVAGSVEALKEALARLTNEEVRVNIVRSGVGALTDSDVMLASASDGILLGFNVRPTSTAKEVAEREGVEIRTYDVIYKALEEIEAAMRGMLAPETAENETGTAEVRAIFRVPGAGTVAGCYVTRGEIFRNNRVRVVRDGTVVYDGNIASLRALQGRRSLGPRGLRVRRRHRELQRRQGGRRPGVLRDNRDREVTRGPLFCTVRLELELPFASSLKDKRQTLRSIKDRLRRKNVSVVESDHHDSWQRATVEVALAAVSRGAAEEKREEIRRQLLNYDELAILEWREEFVKL